MINYKIIQIISFLTIMLVIALKVTAEESNDPLKASPEGNIDNKNFSKLVKGSDYMIVTADKRASIAAKNILERGGTAIDAVIAAQMVLNLVEPQSSGVGGGGFLLYYDAKKSKLVAFDGREKAPIKFNENIFIDQNGKKQKFLEAVSGGLSVGAPSLLPMLEMAHEKYGFLNWKDLFEEAIFYAQKGFIIGKRLSELSKKAPHLNNFPETKEYFNIINGGLEEGKKLVNLKFANTLRIIRDNGSNALVEGDLAENLLIALKKSKRPGVLQREDLSLVKPIMVEPICGNYRGWKICGMGPPSSGGITILQILGILEHFDFNIQNKENKLIWHLFLEASKLAYADRDFYIADDKFIYVPIKNMLDPKYLNSRADEIDLNKINEPKKPGILDIKNHNFKGKDTTSEMEATTHISIVDQYGNAASLTSSIEFMFGSGVMTGGFLLNNQMTDFSFYPKDKKGNLIANRAQSKKKPRSSMSPTIVFDKSGRVRLVLGSPGGSRIICYVASALIRFIDFDIPIEEIVESPNICNRGNYSAIEIGERGNKLAALMESYGYKVKRKHMVSGLHIIFKDQNAILWGAADPRREGLALGK